MVLDNKVVYINWCHKILLKITKMKKKENIKLKISKIKEKIKQLIIIIKTWIKRE